MERIHVGIRIAQFKHKYKVRVSLFGSSCKLYLSATNINRLEPSKIL